MKIVLNDPLFVSAQPIMQRLESHGYEAYFVGGCVRDTLLGQPIHDIDIATSARPEEIEAIFNLTIDIGKEHGTIIVVENRTHYEITTFRTEGNYSDFRHPDYVDFVRDLREDTLRRDFTINALAFDRKGQLYDYHQGISDLKLKAIRAVGVPYERFTEDALRIVRAIRFASQLGFEIEPNTYEAIQNLGVLLPKIAIERIRVELTKFFLGPYFEQYAQLLVDSKISRHISLLKELPVKEALDFMVKIMNHCPIEDERLAWFLFTKGLGLDEPTLRLFLRQWTHSNQFIQEVTWLHQLYDILLERPLTNWDVYYYPIELIEMLETILKPQFQQIIGNARLLYQQLPVHNKKQIVTNGKDLLTLLGLTKGNAQVGQLLQQVEFAIVMNELANDRKAIEAFIHQQLIKER
ncbi:CCA tRNA nucleotidyltransferase [Tuanshanicoccus lijuaniae]|uniref:CCA tRNA nucleotidyltransferase n=1 Tax=Aerococcaceae bacterium zg-1292 TaxID=2774330 RepID=UPI0019367D76|nr:CCA tRNA nucleotidyltransferase [Aerococcaceae bacterium zg-1292]QQA36344.1 CCA tRNA nucleotidyltransferase [Aerococcaceae bacterium zg-1292]